MHTLQAPSRQGFEVKQNTGLTTIQVKNQTSRINLLHMQ